MKKIIKEIQREIKAATERKEWMEVRRLADLGLQAENTACAGRDNEREHPAADKTPFTLNPIPTVIFDNHGRDDIPF